MVSPLEGWRIRKKQTITGSTAGAQTNYQMKMTVHKGSGTDSSTDVYCDGACRDDFGDIRWTKSDGTTLLDYWMDEANYVSGDYAVFWIEIDSIPASPSTVDIYMYYDNSSATSISNGSNTFLFFDDFEYTDSPSNHGWSITDGSSYISTSTDYSRRGSRSLKIDVPDTKWARMKKTFAATNEIAVEVDYYETSSSETSIHTGLEIDEGVDDYIDRFPWVYDNANYKGSINNTDGVVSSVARSNGWHHFRNQRDGSNAKSLIDGSVVSESSYSSTQTVQEAGLCSGSSGGYSGWASVRYWDTFRIMKYVSPEPAWGSWSDAETFVLATETLNISDTVSSVVDFHRTLAESVALTDTGVFDYSVELNESLSLAEKMGLSCGIFPPVSPIHTVEPKTSFAFPKWEIRCFDSDGNEKKTLSPIKNILSWRIDNSVTPESDSFTININNKDGRYTGKFTVGDIILFYIGRTLTPRLRGILESVSWKVDSGGEIITLKGKDYTSIFIRRIIDANYTDVDVKKIITATLAVDGYSGLIELAGLSSDITTNNVEDTDHSVSVKFKGKTLLDCLKELADMMLAKDDGEKYMFYLDVDKDLHFFKESSSQTSSDKLEVGVNIISCNFEQDTSRIANKVKVEGAYIINKNIDTFNVGAGETQYTFITTFPNIDRIIYLKVDGTEKEEGVDYTSNYLAGIISYSNGVAGAATVEISYLYKARISTTNGWMEDAVSQSVYGVKEYVFKTDIDNQNTIDSLTQYLLNYYKNAIYRGTAKTTGIYKTYAGDKISVYYPNATIYNTLYKVIKITFEYSSSGGLTETLTFEETIPDIAELLKQLLREHSDTATRMP